MRFRPGDKESRISMINVKIVKRKDGRGAGPLCGVCGTIHEIFVKSSRDSMKCPYISWNSLMYTNKSHKKLANRVFSPYLKKLEGSARKPPVLK